MPTAPALARPIEQRQPALAGRTPPAVGSQVVQSPPKAALQVGFQPVATTQQPTERGMQQVSSVRPVRASAMATSARWP